ncbi:PiggyBac transposable element-derived protein [Trichinella spiralis]|uniref:PiggyBac transposable element-derived protein n=1 Tax=Trichinella spiralis TaxID=6334 RepID=A0ABR3KIF4_TRISP
MIFIENPIVTIVRIKKISYRHGLRLAHISEPETDSVDDQRSSFVVESSAKLTSDDEELRLSRRQNLDNKSLHLQKQHLILHAFCKNQLNILDSTSIQHFKYIVEQSHVYAAQCNWNFQITESELEIFLRTLLKMGLVPMLRYSMFQEGLRYLHFNDNSEAVLDRESPRKNTSRLTKKSFHIKEEIS